MQHDRMSRKNNTSGYRGVVFDKSKNRHRAMIRVDGKLNHLGYYLEAREAAVAYDAAAEDLYGPDAVLNFPVE